MNRHPAARTFKVRITQHFVKVAALIFGLSSGASADASDFDPPVECRSCDAWNAPQDPFRIHGNTWYVGVAGLSAILIDTGDGLVLLDDLVAEKGAVHAHFDHAGGIAALQRLSGADVIASPHAAQTLRAGRLVDDDPQFAYGRDNTGFPAVARVRAVEHGE